MPSLQIGEQVEGVPEQVHPVSTQQDEEHPSPFEGIACWSSQVSFPTRAPSPQSSVQTDGVPVHVQPVSSWQVESQPSLFFLSSSSQVSEPTIKPSPHIGEQVSGFNNVPPEQDHPGSMTQVRSEQPSTEPETPSSHSSFPTL